MLIKKSQAQKKENSPACTVWEYVTLSKKLDIATALIHGRYPGAGKAMNEVSDMVYYVISGNGRIHTEKGEYKVEEGDVFFIEAHTWYWVEGEALHLVVPSSPPWNSKQYIVSP